MINSETYKIDRILCPVDFSDLSRLALKYAAVGAKVHDAALVVLHAQRFEIPPYFTPSQVEALTQQLEAARVGAQDSLERYSLDTLGAIADEIRMTFTVIDKHPVDAILDVAGAERPDLIVLGTHGRGGAKRLWLGSVAENVARQAAVPVFMVRQKQHEIIDPSNPGAAVHLRTILAAVDLADESRAGLRVAASIATKFGARMVPVCVIEAGNGQELAEVEQTLKGWAGGLSAGQCVVEPIARRGAAADQILALAHETKADLIVLGAEGSRMSRQPLLGRTTKLVLRQAPVPVLVVPPSAGD